LLQTKAPAVHSCKGISLVPLLQKRQALDRHGRTGYPERVIPIPEAFLYTDGAARGNPGPAAAAYLVASSTGAVLAEAAEFVGTATNNEAEYRALILGLQSCVALGVERVRWTSDSELVVKQVSGTYRVRAAGLQPLYQEAVRLKARFTEVTCQQHGRSHPGIARVDRALNALLDRLQTEGRDPTAAV
jgi:ribonuclease HI